MEILHVLSGFRTLSNEMTHQVVSTHQQSYHRWALRCCYCWTLTFLKIPPRGSSSREQLRICFQTNQCISSTLGCWRPLRECYPVLCTTNRGSEKETFNWLGRIFTINQYDKQWSNSDFFIMSIYTTLTYVTYLFSCVLDYRERYLIRLP